MSTRKLARPPMIPGKPMEGPFLRTPHASRERHLHRYDRTWEQFDSCSVSQTSGADCTLKRFSMLLVCDA